MATGIETTTSKIGYHEMMSGPRKGEKFVMSALGLKEYASGRSQALINYKREKIAGVIENVDLLPESERAAVRKMIFEEANRIEYEDLPKKVIKVPRKEDDGKELMNGDGHPVMFEQEFDYGMWWMSEHPDGMMFSLWLTMTKHPSQSTMTLQQVSDIFTESPADLEAATQLTGELSEPKIGGNTEAPPGEGTETRRQRRRRRKRTGR